MNDLLLAASTEVDHVSWPDALVLIALFVLAGFVAWLFFGRR